MQRIVILGCGKIESLALQYLLQQAGKDIEIVELGDSVLGKKIKRVIVDDVPSYYREGSKPSGRNKSDRKRNRATRWC